MEGGEHLPKKLISTTKNDKEVSVCVFLWVFTVLMEICMMQSAKVLKENTDRDQYKWKLKSNLLWDF